MDGPHKIADDIKSFCNVVGSWRLPVMVLDENLSFVFANSAYLASTHKTWADLSGKYVFDAFPDNPDRVAVVLEKFNACLAGQVTDLQAQPYSLVDSTGRETLHFWQASQEPFFADNGRVTHLVQYTQDVTDGIKAEQERELIAHELNHRVKNILSVIQSVARLSSRGQSSVKEYAENFIERINAMARVHGRLFENNFTGTSLEKLFSDELDAISGGNQDLYNLSGEDIVLSPKLSKDLGMIVHELATNAAKYGSFSADTGHLAITWTHEGDVTNITWHETGVGNIGPLSDAGFGSRLLKLIQGIECSRVVTEDGLKIDICVQHGQFST